MTLSGLLKMAVPTLRVSGSISPLQVSKYFLDLDHSTQTPMLASYLDSIWVNLTITGVEIFLKILITVLKHQC